MFLFFLVSYSESLTMSTVKEKNNETLGSNGAIKLHSDGPKKNQFTT